MDDDLDDIYEDFEGEIRPLEEIRAAEEEYFERVWYYRALAGRPRAAEGLAVAEPRLQEIEAKYSDLVTEDQFELGVIHGKLAALRWVIGQDWTMDT